MTPESHKSPEREKLCFLNKPTLRIAKPSIYSPLLNCLLLKTMISTDSLNSRVFYSLATDNVKALQLVRQCPLLESTFSMNTFNTNLSSKILSSSETLSKVHNKKEIREMTAPPSLLTESSTHPSQLKSHRQLITVQLA